MNNDPGIQVIARAATVLRSLEGQADGLSLTQIAQLVGLARSTVARIVNALREEQFVMAASPTSGVRLGPALSRLAGSASVHFDNVTRPIMTELSRHMPDGAIDAWVQQIQEQRRAAGEPPFEFKSIPQGAATSIWAGVVANADEVGGKYCEDCQVAELISVDSQVSAISKGVRGYALDAENAKALWKKSEELVGEVFA